MFAPVEKLRRVPLRQVTLGGEVADQPILNQLREIYPTARIAHIYATTEMGRCFSVTDGRAGFPVKYLESATADGVQLKVVEDQLWVRSANAMMGYDAAAGESDHRADHDGWFPTKDLVEVRDGRVYFAGRTSDMINVGGNKVFPVAVERVIRQLPEVADVRVYGVDSSVAGQLVGCQAVSNQGYSEEALRTRILQHCQQHLDRYQCPRIVEVVKHLRLNDAGKVARE